MSPRPTADGPDVPARALWTCVVCRRSFAHRNQVHSCAVPGDLEQHFSRSERQVRDAFNAVVDAVGELGPVEVLSPRNVVHSFRLHGPDDVDTEFRAWLAEAYDVGCQRHLRR